MSITQRTSFCGFVENFVEWYLRYAAPEMTNQNQAILADTQQDFSERPPQPIVRWTRPAMKRNAGYAFIGIDFETNGRTPVGRYQVLEIAAMNYASGSVFHSLINPGADIVWNKTAENIHGISRQMVVNENVLEWDAVWEQFLKWVEEEANGNRVILVAHNGNDFDFPILMRRSKVLVNGEWYFLDTLMLARHLARRNHLTGKLDLETLRKTFSPSSHGKNSF